MTIWRPGELAADVPRYQAIADALARDVDGGVLEPGQRLPTHRELARALGVTVGTVSRGYAEAERRGLTVGEVGRGTFVRRRREPADHGWSSGGEEDGESRLLDLSICTPVRLPDGREERALAATLEQIAGGDGLAACLRYQPAGATPDQRRAGARWIGLGGFEVDPARVLVTVGVQHGLTVVLSTLLDAGDVLLCGELTYPGLKALARLLGLRLRGVPLDAEGLRPDELERLCRQEPRPAAVYLVPTMQNPTGVTMSEERRREIAAVARRHDLLVVEDGVHAHLAPRPEPPVAAHAPERTVFLTSLTKSVNMGLRTGYLHAPAEMVERLRAGVRSTLWMAPPLMSEVAARWILDGTAEELLRAKRREVEGRQEMVRRVLPEAAPAGSLHAYHAWLRIPEPWRSDEMVAQCRQRGVLVAGAEAFAVGRGGVPHAVRIAVGQVGSRDRLRRALDVLADILAGSAEPCVELV